MPTSPEILTFGCRLNAFESEVVRALARDRGLEDAVIVNTCGVTNEAVRQVRQAIRKARRERPHAEIIVTGCAAQMSPDLFAAMPEVDRVLGNAEKLRPESWAPSGGAPAARVAVSDIRDVRETAWHLVDSMSGRARAFVQVQNGCDHDCTFCIIPKGRGASRSVPLGRVVAQVRRFVESGHAEVVLTGVDTTSYGADLPGRPTLGELAAEVLASVPELPRLRLSSIDSVEVDDALLRVVAEEERFMPHLHLSLQAGDDLVLRRMKRRHARADAVALCRRVRALRHDVLFGADLIAGFPTESDAMFERTLTLVEDCDLTFLHVFPFSPREGTPAARMPPVPAPVVRERAARLRAAGTRSLRRSLDRLVGTQQRVLVERGERGRSPGFAVVRIPGQSGVDGRVVDVRVEAREGNELVGRRLALA